jgi:hypothetical protein
VFLDLRTASLDIILCLRDDLPDEFDGEELGSEAFGYSDDPERDNWDEDFASSTVTLPGGETVTTTGELRTEMLRRTINLVDSDGEPLPEGIDYLSHDDFFYFILVENLSDESQSVTARVFLAPETEVEDRTSWIEMDKFLYRLDGSERAVIFRCADLSSVIRKPALKPEDLTPETSPLPRPTSRLGAIADGPIPCSFRGARARVWSSACSRCSHAGTTWCYLPSMPSIALRSATAVYRTKSTQICEIWGTLSAARSRTASRQPSLTMTIWRGGRSAFAVGIAKTLSFPPTRYEVEEYERQPPSRWI